MIFYFILSENDREYPAIAYASTDLEKVRRKATTWDVICKYEGDTFEFDCNKSLNEQPECSIFEGTIQEYFNVDDIEEIQNLEGIQNLRIDWDKYYESDYPYETDYDVTYENGKVVKDERPDVKEIIQYIKENCICTPKEYESVNEVFEEVMSGYLSKSDAFDIIRNMLSCENSK